MTQDTNAQPDAPPLTEGALEAVLFTAADAVALTRLAQVFGCTTDAIQNAITAYNAAAAARGGGLRMLVHDGAVQLMTDAALQDAVARFLRDVRTEPLSQAALETLAVIAYRGPITRSAIEAIRGVHCGSALRRLLLRGLIVRTRDRAARVYRYRVTAAFLAHCGIARPEDLPDYAALRDDERLTQAMGQAANDDSV